MTKLVIGCPLLFIHQDIVGFGSFFEFAIRVGVIRIAVRVVLHCDAAIRLLDVLIRGAAIDS